MSATTKLFSLNRPASITFNAGRTIRLFGRTIPSKNRRNRNHRGKTLNSGAMLLACLALCAGNLQAGDINVNISSNITDDIRTWTSGAYYPPGGFSTNIAGVSFYISSFPGSTSGLGVVYTGSGTVTAPSVTNFPANVTNASTVYTLINSSWGEPGYTDGTIDFYGSQGAHASFDLVQGINIRDHRVSGYSQTISSNIMSIYWGPAQIVRFDCQGWMLPTSFYAQVLTNIQIRSFGNNPDGVPTVIAITVRTGGPILTIARAEKQAACYWPSTPTNFILQTATSFQNPNWTNVASRPFVTNNQFVTTNACIDSLRFYRLISLP